jgi:hypothetical protein
MVWSAADRVIFATVRKSFFAPETAAYFFGFAVTCLRQPRGDEWGNTVCVTHRYDRQKSNSSKNSNGGSLLAWWRRQKKIA